MNLQKGWASARICGRFGRLKLILSMLALSAASAATAAPTDWAASWSAPPAAPVLAAPSFWPDIPLTPALDNQTIVQVVRLSSGGRRLRIRLSNEFGDAPLDVGDVRVAPLRPDGTVDEQAARKVTFSGAARAVIPAHAPLVSDPIDLTVTPLSRLQIRVYLPGPTGPATAHFQAAAKSAISPPGDYTDRSFTPAQVTGMRLFLSEVDVQRDRRAPVVVAFGDSITDGVGSTDDADHRWPDFLAERLAPTGAAVINAGIGGNQLLRDAGVAGWGQSGLARLDRDVLAVPGVTHLIVLEGINDISNDPAPTAQALIAGYRQIIARAHAKGLKIILGSILPVKGSWVFKPEKEALRQTVNAWILSQHEADGVVDFDAAVRNPDDPSSIRKELQSGDWIHPNDAGYRVMSEAVNLSLFK
jgi:lysophospholipase L1-like esterase